MHEAARPSPERVHRTLLLVARTLGQDICWLYQRRFHFVISDEVTVALSAESAGRFRVELCRFTRPETTLWVLDGEDDRLAGIVLNAAAENSPTTGGDAHGCGALIE